MGAGTIERPSNTKYLNLLFQDVKSLQAIAVLFNGKIREFLDVKSINKIVRTRDNYVETSYEVITSKKSSSEKLINYLNEYPLFSSKDQDFRLSLNT